MLKDGLEPVVPWQCIMTYTPGSWNCTCGVQNDKVIETSFTLSIRAFAFFKSLANTL